MKKKIQIKLSFKSRLELFIMKFRIVRRFPDYSLTEELRELFFPRKREAIFG